ncbi:LacI family DNA-binding transcriptional regulator [Paracoccus alkanivorans]|uniref:LacI family DNA-binding transcriptional regulator n=1 Tax=Paracoccus alkanivorans TaxID=2116655 RepID=UPI001407CB0C|nr:LacI family DNA-binding transcriptional regulator [Paracoccus alkanivorans]
MNIKELARHLDLSIGTVSRALNDKPDVNPQTRERVLNAAIELGYSANASGRSLRRGSTQTIAFMLETGHPELSTGHNFFMRVIGAMQPELHREGFDLVILPCHPTTDPTSFLRRTIARGMADAIIVTATQCNDPRIELLLKSRIPFVALGRSRFQDRHPWIDLDFERFVDVTMDELVRRGHERIAMTILPNDSNISHVLRDAYAAAHERLGLKHDPALIVTSDASEFGGNQATRQILAMERPATAILLNNEQMAFGVYAALFEAGLTPGRDMSVATLRRSKQLRFLNPPVTAFDIDLEALGRELAKQALRALRGETPLAALLWPSHFVPTDSLADVPGTLSD